MNRYISAAAFAATVLLSSTSIDAVLSTATAQDVSIDFDTFHDQLAPYGDWVYSDRWGEVWIPNDVPEDFHPYGTAGHWAYTDDYGWTWVSDYEWGDIPFHYGRWVNDPEDGWLWIPGYVWSPAWVTWRSNGQYTGWMPMPPDEQFLGGTGFSIGVGGGGIGFSVNFNDTSSYYGYSDWYGPSYGEDAFANNWVFVGTGHMADRDFHRYEAPRANYVTFIHNTKNITNYTIVNNYVVNRSVDVHQVERASGHPVETVKLAAIVKKPQFITHESVGRDVQVKMRQEIPRGTGKTGSAPAPSQKVVQSLSTKVSVHNGHQPMHLYTKDTVTKAPLVNKGGAAPNTEMNNSMKGPNGSEMGTKTQGTGAEGNKTEEMKRHETGTQNGEGTPSTTGGSMKGPSNGSEMGTQGTGAEGNKTEEMKRHETGTQNGAGTPSTTGGSMKGPSNGSEMGTQGTGTRTEEMKRHEPGTENGTGTPSTTGGSMKGPSNGSEMEIQTQGTGTRTEEMKRHETGTPEGTTTPNGSMNGRMGTGGSTSGYGSGAGNGENGMGNTRRTEHEHTTPTTNPATETGTPSHNVQKNESTPPSGKGEENKNKKEKDKNPPQPPGN